MKKEISLKELENYLNNLLNPQLFDESSYNGVQIETKKSISKIITAVSVSKEIIKKTIEHKAQALIVHHGLFRKNNAHPLIEHLYDYIEQLIKNDIALFCYHLPLDAHQEIGNNWKAAKNLNLKNLIPCLPLLGNNIAVMGEIESTDFEKFRKKVELYYERSANFVKVHNTIKKVVIASGGADKFIKDVAQLGADCLITGRVDEPVWDAAHEYGVSFLGLGHYSTEVIGIKALAQQLEKHFKIPVIFIKTDNPF